MPNDLWCPVMEVYIERTTTTSEYFQRPRRLAQNTRGIFTHTFRGKSLAQTLGIAYRFQ